ncbi:hypothetical protein L2E82_19658 [Cichorium intybus]|uniref:Uncharacterized protein n=1 Tax=Cichorium intybus TaxID=13427 RepID=A0ACB9FD25_CICIN|nr:hypothetical protein L2E82_19658 [Cichorium intybus]
MKEDSQKDLEKNYFDVLGLCCSLEVPLIEKILAPLEGERNTRLENMCWRIWNLALQKKQLTQQPNALLNAESSQRNNCDKEKPSVMYLTMVKATEVVCLECPPLMPWKHGLINKRGKTLSCINKVRYVVELARALASMPGVYRADLLTR